MAFYPPFYKKVLTRYVYRGIIRICKVYIPYIYFTATILLYHILRGTVKMTKKDMRRELDFHLSWALQNDYNASYSAFLTFAFFIEIISASEYKWLTHAFS